MGKSAILKKIHNAAKNYQRYLAGKTFMYVYEGKSIEVVFKNSSFLHLTGVNTKLKAKEFYKHAKTKNGLKVQEFFFDKDHPYDLAEKKTDHLEDLYRITNMEVLITEDVVTFTANYKIGITDLQFILLCGENRDKHGKLIDDCLVPLYKTPKSIQETIEIMKVAENGIFEVSRNHFSKCYRFRDINYTTTNEEEQCLFYVAVTLIIVAESKEELESVTETVETIGKRNSVTIDTHYLKQREALNTALPIGVRQVETMRTMLTQSVAVLMPFNVQELNAVGGNYYGINQISKNINVGNRKGLINGNGFIFGVPGSGKSFFAKQEMGNVFLNTPDDVIVIDPMNEYFDIADTFGGAIVNLSAYTKNYVNPLAADLAHMNERGIRDVIADKSEFMLSLCDQLLGNALNQKHHSIIDRCIRELYMRAWKVKKVPVMTDFYHILKSQKEMEAQELALSLELFVEGSLNIFNHQTNVDVDNRFTVYGIQDLGSQLAPVAMLVMMEAIQQRIIDNGKRGRATWLYIDECHVLLNSDYSATYLQQLWKKVRKQGGLCTGITQNVVDLLQNYIAMTLLSNSEFVALLKQANVDSAKLAEVIGVSDAQLQYVHNSPSGTGLLKCGSVVIPFDNQISKDSDLYKLYNTNIHEKIAMGMVGEDSIFHGYHSDEMTEDFSEADDGTQDSVFTSDEWNGDSDLDEAPETDVKIYEPVRSKEKKEQDNCWLIYE